MTYPFSSLVCNLVLSASGHKPSGSPGLPSTPVIEPCYCATSPAICQHQLPPTAIGAPGTAPTPQGPCPVPPCSQLASNQMWGLQQHPHPTIPGSPLASPQDHPHTHIHPSPGAGGCSGRAGALGPGWKHPSTPPHSHPALLNPLPATALGLFHQAQDGFLNKSKKLHFLLGKFILSHFISFPPIFFPNNVIK